MKKHRALAILLVVGASAGMAVAAPSDDCDPGQLSASETPLGVGVYVVGDPAEGDPPFAHVCNNGDAVPSPLKGRVTVFSNPNAFTVWAEFNGDPDNTALACSSGFVRFRFDGTGPYFYQSPQGHFGDTDPSRPGNQRAEPQEPDEWVQNIVADCTAGDLPEPPGDLPDLPDPGDLPPVPEPPGDLPDPGDLPPVPEPPGDLPELPDPGDLPPIPEP